MYFGASHRGVGGEWADASCAFNKQASQTNNENCRGLGMLAASSSLGGRSAAVSMAQVRNGGWSAAARRRRLGIASGCFGLTAERKRVDTVGAAGGVGDSESVAVKDSLWP